MSTVDEQTNTSGIQVALTPRAIEEVLKFMEAEQVPPDAGGLRVSVLPGGCSGFKYSLNIEERPLEDDHRPPDRPGPGLRRRLQPAVPERRHGRLRDLDAGLRIHLHQPERDRRVRVRQQLHRVDRRGHSIRYRLRARRSLLRRALFRSEPVPTVPRCPPSISPSSSCTSR